MCCNFKELELDFMSGNQYEDRFLAATLIQQTRKLLKLKIQENDYYREDQFSWGKALSQCNPNLQLRIMVCDNFEVHQLFRSNEANKMRQRQSQFDAVMSLGRAQKEEVGNGGNIEELGAIIARFTQVRESIAIMSWVCLELEHLSANFMMHEDASGDWDVAVFERLSKLTKLKILDVGCVHLEVAGMIYKAPNPGVRGLRFDLVSGLDYLAPLKDMEQLLFEDVEQYMHPDDIRWILHHWPKLTNITTELNAEWRVNRKLKSMVECIRDVTISDESDSGSDSSTDDEEYD
ncbi:hypothetical protein EMPS_02158 [Entomortierella parvispora]|uniref:Uncharacterized protein n=1 Tax=Entomortierella parvispora TaxID=205924 RepID=A0A9P3H477_9FUNG|nr:hypothetical protein EMPS_02158 [Entomortierella parvispora]